jgi:hypothetical protein
MQLTNPSPVASFKRLSRQWGCRLERNVRTRMGERLGASEAGPADPIAMHDVRRDLGPEAKSHIAGVPGAPIDSVDRSAACAGLCARGTGGSS